MVKTAKLTYKLYPQFINLSSLMTYSKDTSGRLWWCNVHGRRATVVLDGMHLCDPKLGGIAMMCRCVDLTDMVEIEDDKKGPTCKLTPHGPAK